MDNIELRVRSRRPSISAFPRGNRTRAVAGDTTHRLPERAVVLALAACGKHAAHDDAASEPSAERPPIDSAPLPACARVRHERDAARIAFWLPESGHPAPGLPRRLGAARDVAARAAPIRGRARGNIRILQDGCCCRIRSSTSAPTRWAGLAGGEDLLGLALSTTRRAAVLRFHREERRAAAARRRRRRVHRRAHRSGQG